MNTTNLFVQSSNPVIHYYYIEEASRDLLNPTKIIENANGTKTLEFRDNFLENFFNQFTIYHYDREFKWSRNTELHKYYLIGVHSQHILNNLNSINEIVFAEYIGTGEEYPLNTMNSPNPDDYIDNNDVINAWVPLPTEPNEGFTVFNVRPYEHLELVNAKRAWNITTGDPTIAIGIKDINFYLDHPDLENEVLHLK
ncbi:hypothetical protein [Psychroflexus salis]|uniref:Uncharacterized protein n=1 Tax=Psychroflexus salis TaxID=1526574 RepID=A0A917E5P9_9FLAO|nr:hypothetical protein [Psychroflexus salis]GGE07074.1 hypothetical protein GCM10010831_05720 [Psychroflexus salis]